MHQFGVPHWVPQAQVSLSDKLNRPLILNRRWKMKTTPTTSCSLSRTLVTKCQTRRSWRTVLGGLMFFLKFNGLLKNSSIHFIESISPFSNFNPIPAGSRLWSTQNQPMLTGSLGMGKLPTWFEPPTQKPDPPWCLTLSFFKIFDAYFMWKSFQRFKGWTPYSSSALIPRHGEKVKAWLNEVSSRMSSTASSATPKRGHHPMTWHWFQDWKLLV